MEAKLFVFAALAISEVFSACAPKGTRLKNFQRLPKRSNLFKVSVVSKKCPGLNEFYYDWKVQELPYKKVVQTSSDQTLVIDGYTYSSARCFLTEYLVTVKISHYPDMTYSHSASGTFRFQADPMHIEILGGSFKTHLLGQDLIMDAQTLSKDLSYPQEEDAFVGNTIIWKVTPDIPFYSPPNYLKITIPGELLVKDTVYIFNVTVMRTKIPRFKDTRKAAQVVEIIASHVPLLNIFCMRNCIHPHHLEVTVFGVHCNKNCEDLSYKWYVEPTTPADRMDLGDGYDKLVLLDGAYKEGEIIIVGVMTGGKRITKTFKFSSGIRAGVCHVDPGTGISAITKFTINCTGFFSPYGVIFYNIYQVKEDEEFLINEEGYFDVSEVYLSPGNPASIKVEVQDTAYLTTYATLDVNVRKFRPRQNINYVAAVKQLVLATDMTSITSYSLEGFHNEAVQLILALLDAMEDIPMDDATVRDLHKHMAEALLRIQPERFATAYQRMMVLIQLQKHKLEYDMVTSGLIGKAMMDSALHLHKMHNHQHDVQIPQTFIEHFAMQTVNLSTNLLKKSGLLLNILNNPTPIHEYDSYDDYVYRKLQIKYEYQKMMRNIMVSLQTNCITALHRTYPEEQAKYYGNDILIIQTQRKLLSNILQTLVMVVAFGNVTNTTVTLQNKLVRQLESKNPFMDIQVGVFLKNPFWWHMNATTINTHVIFFDLFVKCDKIRTIKTPIIIQFEILSIPWEVKNGTLTEKSIAAYKIEMEPHQTLIVRFENVPDEYTTYKVTWAECYCTLEDFDSPQSRLIANSTDPSHKLLEINHGEDDFKPVFVCIKKITPEVSYRMALTAYSCVYWDIRKSEWNSKGCRVTYVGFDHHKALNCVCYHLSLFAGQIAIPPSTLIIDDDIDFTIDFVDNYVMISLVIGFLLLWLLFLLFAHYTDTAMKRRNVVHKLDDNVPGDPHPYLVVFFTGFFFDAQTTADVAFQLVGEEGKSRIHLVKCKGFKLLQRNTQDWFTLYSPFYLGNLKKIKLWHNCKGKSPHWYCERVIVQDLKTATQYCFTVEKWFSLIWGTGKIYREIHIRKPEQQDPYKLALAHMQKDLKEQHIWLSILVRDYQSNFDSKERVSTGFCFLFLAMLANAFFSGTPMVAPSDSIDDHGYFFVGLAEFAIIVESWLTATPMALFIIFLFKNSRPVWVKECPYD